MSEFTKEKEFSKAFELWLRDQKISKSIKIHSEKRITYALEMNEYEGEARETKFETDIIVDFKGRENFPAVVIEVKLDRITTHDAMVYGLKAEHHRNIYPYLRYGMLIGNISSIPPRLVRHGKRFDFLITLQGVIPSEKEAKSIRSLLRKEIETAKRMREILRDNRKGDRSKFWYIHNQTKFKEL